MAVGAIDANGRYTLSTERTEGAADGAIVGYHKVRITAPQATSSQAVTFPPSRIPRNYTHQDRSGLTAQVKSGKTNVIDFDLTSAAK